MLHLPDLRDELRVRLRLNGVRMSMDLAEYNDTRPKWEWYTFVVRLDLMAGSTKSKWMNSWEIVVYRKGDTPEEAAHKVYEDFGNPFVVASFKGRHEKIKGSYYSEFQWDPNCP